MFSTLLSLLYLTSTQILYHINVADLSDLSQCLPFVQNACKKMKFLRMLFSALNARIGSIRRNEQCVSRETKNIYTNFDANNISIAKRNILLQSPKINLSLNQRTDDDLFYERLCSSSMEGAR